MASNKKSTDKKSKVTGSSSLVYSKMRSNRIAKYDYELLEVISHVSNITNICVRILKRDFKKTKYYVSPVDGANYDKLAPYIDNIRALLANPNSNGDTYISLMGKMLDDVIRLDNGVIEKVRNLNGEIVELYQVAGKTIYPNIDDYGIFYEDAWHQFVDYQPGLESNEPSASFGIDDLLIFQNDPQGGAKAGRGESPVAAIASTIATSIQLNNYNASTFDTAKIPPVILNLQEADKDNLSSFKAALTAEMEKNQHAIGFSNAKGMDTYQLRPNNSDMEYQQFYDTLSRIIAVGFGLTPMDIGLTQDVNRSTAESQEKIRSDGLDALLSTIEDEINNDLIGDLAVNVNPAYADIEFRFENETKEDELQKSQIDQTYIFSGVYTPEYVRQRDGIELPEGDEPLSLTNNNEDNFSKSLQDKWLKFYQ